MKINKFQFAKGLEHLFDVGLGEVEVERSDI